MLTDTVNIFEYWSLSTKIWPVSFQQRIVFSFEFTSGRQMAECYITDGNHSIELQRLLCVNLIFAFLQTLWGSVPVQKKTFFRRQSSIIIFGMWKIISCSGFILSISKWTKNRESRVWKLQYLFTRKTYYTLMRVRCCKLVARGSCHLRLLMITAIISLNVILLFFFRQSCS